MTLMLALKYIREITIAVLTIAVIALIGLYGQSRADIKQLKTEHALELTTLNADYQTRARKLEQEQYDQTITAINAATARAKADAANAETDADYRAQYAATTGQLLKECSGSITALAAAADGHVNDIRFLQDAR